MLHREARALAISRLEESARTEEEFANVISWWDKLDDNRERRERYHEIGRSEVPLEWHASDYVLPGNANYDMVLWQQILASDFIDYIFDEPDYIHELVSYIIWTTTVLMNRQKTCIVRECLHLAEYPRLTISH